jgi:beta-1,4-N-acetylglucosaminyltransferase
MQRCFVTVGSTTFDPLIEACLAEHSLHLLKAHGIKELCIQAGKSKYAASLYKVPDIGGLTIEIVDYLDDLSAELAAAHLVISHCGAGTVLDCLRLPSRPPLIVVANETLMDNHQIELRDALVKQNYCMAATPSTLHTALEQLAKGKQTPFKALAKSDGSQLNRIIAEELMKLQ